MEADAKSMPFMVQHIRVAVGPEARQTAWVQPCQPSSHMAILQTQEKKKKKKAGVIEANWGSKTGRSIAPTSLQAVGRALGEGSDNGSRGSTHS